MGASLPTLDEIRETVRAVVREELKQLLQGTQMLDPAAAAKHLGISRRQLYRLVNRGPLPAADLKLGRVVRWRRDSLESAARALAESDS